MELAVINNTRIPVIKKAIGTTISLAEIPARCIIVIPVSGNSDILGKLFTDLRDIGLKTFFPLEKNELDQRDILAWATQTRSLILINPGQLKPEDVLCLEYHCQIMETKLTFIDI